MTGLNSLVGYFHDRSVSAGWWDDLERVKEQLPDTFDQEMVETWFLASKIALIHSEVSEMLEGLRKGIPDDHLPDRQMEEVEGADVFIRLADYMGRRGFDLEGAVEEKDEYNAHRADHTAEARAAEGGKTI